MSDEPADYRQQEELEELYAWFKETNKSFEEIFLGGKHDGLHDTEKD